MLGPGTILGAKYRLEREIGRGGMGSVWLATRLDLDTHIAIKVLHGEASSKPGGVERFTREAKAAASLTSPHVVRILDFGADPAGGVAFMAMELLEGESLAARLSSGQRLGAARVASIITQVARALSQAHGAGIVHRDLKPANIFLVRNGDDELVKLLDFGIAKAGDGLSTATGSVLGTPYYMSPEQVNCAKDIDFRTDLWSLGVIACECLTLRRPFGADTLSELAMKIALGRAEPPSSLGSVPAGFDEWFARATAVDRRARFQSATELASALTKIAENAPLPSTSPPEPGLALAATLHAGQTQALDSKLSTTSSGSTTLPSLAEASLAAKTSPRRRLGIGIAAIALLSLAGVSIAALSLPERPAAQTQSLPSNVAGGGEGLGAAASGAIPAPSSTAMAATPNGTATPPTPNGTATAAAPSGTATAAAPSGTATTAAASSPVAAEGVPSNAAAEAAAGATDPAQSAPGAPSRIDAPVANEPRKSPKKPAIIANKSASSRPSAAKTPAARPSQVPDNRPAQPDPLDAYDLQ